MDDVYFQDLFFLQTISSKTLSTANEFKMATKHWSRCLVLVLLSHLFLKPHLISRFLQGKIVPYKINTRRKKKIFCFLFFRYGADGQRGETNRHFLGADKLEQTLLLHTHTHTQCRRNIDVICIF